MKTFFTKLLWSSLLIYLANLGLGLGLKALGPEYSDSAYGQVKWEDFRRIPPNSLDILFLGSSHFLSGIDPAIIDSVSGMNSYNMARVGLRPASAYILLQEVLQKQRPEYVVLDIFHRTFIGSGYNHLYDFGYVRYDSGKVDFALTNFSLAENTRLLFPTYLYRSNFPKAGPLLGLNKKKANWRELHYKGYIAHPETVPLANLEENEFLNYRFDPSDIDPSSLQYLEKLVALCKEHHIKLRWVTTPIPDICLEGIQNNEQINDYFNLLSDQADIPYLNYNDPVRKRALGLSDSSDYSDDDHLNVSGARKLSIDIAQVLLNEPGRRNFELSGEHQR